MEVIAIGDQYEVQFNSAPILGCYDDIDCPGIAQICAVNESWAVHKNMCTCDPRVGWIGYDCNLIGPISQWVLGTMFTTLTILGIALIANMYSISVIFMQKSERKVTSLTIALIWATLSILEFVAASSLILYNAFLFRVTPAIKTGVDTRFPNRINKDQLYGQTHTILLLAAFIFTTMTMFFLIGVWTGIAVSYQRISKHQGGLINKFCTIYLIVSLAILVPATIVPSLLVIGFAIIELLIIILGGAFIFAGYKIRGVQLIQSAAPAVTATVPMAKARSEMLTKLLRRIYLTSFVLGGLSLTIAVFFGGYSLGSDRRSTYIPPLISKAWPEFLYRMTIILCACCNAVVVYYLFWTVRGRVANAKELSKLRAMETMNDQQKLQVLKETAIANGGGNVVYNESHMITSIKLPITPASVEPALHTTELENQEHDSDSNRESENASLFPRTFSLGKVAPE